MSASEDEDDFLSADEDVEEEKRDSPVGVCREEPERKLNPPGDQAKINPGAVSTEPTDLKRIDIDEPSERGLPVVQTDSEPKVQARALREQQSARIEDVAKGLTSASSTTSSKSTSLSSESEDSPKVSGTPDEEDAEEESSSERIRERNLKIARKFSAEIAKNVKASAPIPVNKSPTQIGFKISNIEYPSIPGQDTKEGSPPAPPPTPALSSSFSNAEDAIAFAAAGVAAPTGGPAPGPSGATQYGWRVPSKSKPKQPNQQPPSAPPPNPPEDKAAQTRQALDRLSETLSFSSSDSKNLFERVAEDLRKVSIKSDQPASDGGQAFGSAGIPLISDLGSTLGGWNWNSAGKLLASASQVALQIGSVVDSVVNPEPQPPAGQTDKSEPKAPKQSAQQTQPDSP